MEQKHSSQLSQNSNLNGFFFHEPFEENYWPDILEEVYKKQVYLPYLPHTKDSVCIDIGANVGLTVYYFAKRFGKVYAVEPSATHLEALRAMIKQNKLSNVTVVPAALSNKNGETKFYHNNNQTMFSLESRLSDGSNFEVVKTLPIDELLAQSSIERVDLLKMDSEGEEGKIFASDSFAKVKDKIRVIVGEWHDWCGVSKPLFQKMMEDYGYTFKWFYNTNASVFSCVL